MLGHAAAHNADTNKANLLYIHNIRPFNLKALYKYFTTQALPIPNSFLQILIYRDAYLSTIVNMKSKFSRYTLRS